MRDLEDSHRSLRLLEEISTGEELTQRDLSKRAGMALGLVNTYLKNLAAKGYVKISAIPPKRFRYYLTPKGFLEKSRLTYAMLHNYTRVFREARREYSVLFGSLYEAGVRRVVFAGVDEVAEIAYLSLQEVGIGFGGAVDDVRSGKKFFKTDIMDFDRIGEALDGGRVVITTYHRKDHVYEKLLQAGIGGADIDCIYPLEGRKGGSARKVGTAP